MQEALRVPSSEREAFLRTRTDSQELIDSVLRHIRSLAETAMADEGGQGTLPGAGAETIANVPSQLAACDPDATRVLPSATAPRRTVGARTSAALTSSAALRTPQPADFPVIPGYHLTKLLDQGGMGAVYDAIQLGDGFERRVAVKIVKPEVARATVLERFFQERRVLAELDHPNIARLFDAGSTQQGAPFLAMEFVEGRKIDAYCNQQGLDTEQRIRLCLQLCDAIQYAHQRLIVHRDIKPSNVMVTSEGIPKLLDFGIAKLVDTDEQGLERLGLTTVDGTPMTPMYASPEQVQGKQVTTSTDLYSLAILIYEVLTGSLPYQFEQFTAAGIERTIVETNPTPASQAKIERQLAPGESEEKVRRRLRGEMDQILAMALRKEAARRYASVFEFAQDIRHHLEGMPVSAHGDSLRYRAGKFMRRHRAAVAAAVLAVASLAGAAVVSAYFASVAREEKRVAERRFQETRDLARFFITEFDDAIRAGETAARREMVAKGLSYLKRLSEEAEGDPALQREVIAGYIKMGDVQGNPFGPNLGQRDAAAESYRLALTTAERFAKTSQNGALRQETALARRKLADLDAVGRKPREALAVYQEVLPLFDGLDRAEILIPMGFVYSQLGDTPHALDAYQQAESIAAALIQGGRTDAAVSNTLARASERVGESLARTGDFAAAIGRLKTALQIREEQAAVPGSRSPNTLRQVWVASIILGDIYARAKQPVNAEQAYRRCLSISEGLQREDPANRQYRVDFFTTVGRLADVLSAQPRDRREAEKLTADALAMLRPVVERPDASETEIDQYAWTVLTTPFEKLRDPAMALRLLEKRIAKSGSNHPRVLDMLALAYFGVGNREKAIEMEMRALSLLPATPSPLRSELELNLRRFRGLAPAAPRPE